MAFEKIKRIYNKTKFNYMTGYVHPYNFLPTFYFTAKVFRILDDEEAPEWTIILQPIIWILNALGVFLSMLCVYHNVMIFDIPTITEGGVYGIVLSYGVIMVSCMKTNLPHYHYLLRALREDYAYVCGEGSKYRKLFFEKQLITWQLCLSLIVFDLMICFTMQLSTVGVVVVYYMTHKEGDKRPFFFPFWAWDLDFSASPLYEILFWYANVVIGFYCLIYTFKLQLELVWVSQITTKAELIKKALKDMLKVVHPTKDTLKIEYRRNMIKHRMRHVVKLHHQMYESIHHYAAAYKKFLMFEQIIVTPVVTLTSYSSAVKLDDGEFHVILITLGIATASVVFIPCFFVTYLSEKVKSIMDACWDTPFWNADPVIRPYMVLIMQRSLRKLPLQAAGFPEISLETFSNKMTSAYSCFHMLRQIDL